MSSGRQVMAHLDRTKYQPRAVVIDKFGNWKRKLTLGNTDLVFNALHGTQGEDGLMQGYLELIGLPYTGSGVSASAVGMDKVFSKIIFESVGLPITSGIVVGPGERFTARTLPAVVKPVCSGSSVGVCMVETDSELKHAVSETIKRHGRALIEPRLTGRELTVPVLGNERARPLPVIEITPQGQSFFDYRAKYTKGAARKEVPARLPDVLTQQAQHLAVVAHKALGCRGYSRLDLFLTPANHFKVLEINTLPGLTPDSLLPKSAAAAGITYPELLDEIIRCAL